jgi:ankyrin repeat protein
MVEHLLSLGADPNLRDREFDATPLGWANHAQHKHVVDRLTPITGPGPG